MNDGAAEGGRPAKTTFNSAGAARAGSVQYQNIAINLVLGLVYHYYFLFLYWNK